MKATIFLTSRRLHRCADLKLSLFRSRRFSLNTCIPTVWYWGKSARSKCDDSHKICASAKSARDKTSTVQFAFFSFWAALIKIYSYFRLYTFMSIYVKNSCWPCLCLVSHHLQNHIWPSKRLNLISNLLHTHNKELNRTRMGNTQMLN